MALVFKNPSWSHTFALTKPAFFPATKSAWDLSFPLDALGEANWMGEKITLHFGSSYDQISGSSSEFWWLSWLSIQWYSHHIPIIFPSYSNDIPTIFPPSSHHIPIIFLSYSHYLPTIFPSKKPMISPGYHSQESNIFPRISQPGVEHLLRDVVPARPERNGCAASAACRCALAQGAALEAAGRSHLGIIGWSMMTYGDRWWFLRVTTGHYWCFNGDWWWFTLWQTNSLLWKKNTIFSRSINYEWL